MKKLSWIVKINILVLGLGFVVYTMFQVRGSGLPSPLLITLGLSPAHVSPSERLTWCETRVQSMEKPTGFKIYQDRFKWFSSDNTQQEIDFIAMEKWFGKNCSLDIEPLAKNSVESSRFQTALVVNFITGAAEQLLKLGPSIYSWKDHIFRSPQLDSALDELESLPKSNVKK